MVSVVPVGSSKMDDRRTGKIAKQSVKSSFDTIYCSSSILMADPVDSEYHIKTACVLVFLEAQRRDMIRIILTVGEKC
jgi:hypothetical protein